MADNASFTINDGTLDHTFVPSGVDGSTVSHQNKARDYIPGRETSVMRSKQGKTLREVSMTIRIPKVITETINGLDVSRVHSFGSITVKVVVPVDWAPSETEVLLALGAGVPAVPAFAAMAAENEGTW
jgi:hypothetical protein